MSQFGKLVRKLRIEQGLTLQALARKVGTYKGYISGIENGKVNPPSVKIILKYAKALGQDARTFVRIGWVDKAPSLIREDAKRFLAWCQEGMPAPSQPGRTPSPAVRRS